MPFPIAAPVGAALVGGIGSLLGGILANKGQRDASREQMAFQERMSGTAYQRATQDMRMSGINPMLAYAQGGASSPGGAQPDVKDVVSPAVSSASHAGRLSQELKNLKSQDMLLQAQTDAARMSAEHSWSARQLNQAEIMGRGFEMFPNRLHHLGVMGPTSHLYGLEGRRRLLDLERERQGIDLKSFEFPKAGSEARAYRGTGKFGEYTEYVKRLRESLIGGGGFFLGPRIGGR